MTSLSDIWGAKDPEPQSELDRCMNEALKTQRDLAIKQVIMNVIEEWFINGIGSHLSANEGDSRLGVSAEEYDEMVLGLAAANWTVERAQEVFERFKEFKRVMDAI